MTRTAQDKGLSPDNAGTVPVADFRRQSMVLQWHILGGTWTAYDTPPSLVHGVALIRAAQPNICVYGHGGRLRLQVGLNNSPCRRTRPDQMHARRRKLRLEASIHRRVDDRGVLFSHSYWTGSHGGEDFFRWFAARVQIRLADCDGPPMERGVSAPVLRST